MTLRLSHLSKLSSEVERQCNPIDIGSGYLRMAANGQALNANSGAAVS
jgi:hypothetical protein